MSDLWELTVKSANRQISIARDRHKGIAWIPLKIDYDGEQLLKGLAKMFNVVEVERELIDHTGKVREDLIFVGIAL